MFSVPKFIQYLFPHLVWRVKSKKANVYLTFDDGPIPEVTEWVLDQLDEYNAKATFFCIGDNVKKHPAIFNKIIDKKHAIGNHTFHHVKGWNTSTKEYLEEVESCENILLKQIKDKKVKLFRPPYGRITVLQSLYLKSKGYKIIMWDVLSKDYDSQVHPEKIITKVMQYITNGSIVVFHDSIKAKENLYYCLPILLKKLNEKGFKFKKLN